MILRSAHCRYCCAYVLSLLIKHLFLTQIIEEVWWWVWKISVELNSPQLPYRNIHLCQSGIGFHRMKSSVARRVMQHFIDIFACFGSTGRSKVSPATQKQRLKPVGVIIQSQGFSYLLPTQDVFHYSFILIFFQILHLAATVNPALSWFNYGFSCVHWQKHFRGVALRHKVNLKAGPKISQESQRALQEYFQHPRHASPQGLSCTAGSNHFWGAAKNVQDDSRFQFMGRIERMKIAERCCLGLCCTSSSWPASLNIFSRNKLTFDVIAHCEMWGDHFDTFKQIIYISYNNWGGIIINPQTKAVPDDTIKKCLRLKVPLSGLSAVTPPPPPSELGAVPAADARSCPRCWSCLQLPTRSHRRNPPPERPNQNGTSALLRRLVLWDPQQQFSSKPLVRFPDFQSCSLAFIFSSPPTLEVFFRPLRSARTCFCRDGKSDRDFNRHVRETTEEDLCGFVFGRRRGSHARSR